MEFWGAEVKSGQTLSVQPGEGMVLHLSQASLGEVKKDKGSEPVCLSVNVDNKKLVLGTLNLDKVPQQQFDLVFDRDFELSHSAKSGSVYFLGYKASNPFEDEEDEEDEDESDEDISLTLANNGKSEAKVGAAGKASAKDSASAKQKVKIGEPSKAKADDEDESSDEDDMSEDEDDSETGEDEDESDEDQSDEETPKKASKKRPADSATKTPPAEKKAKFATPQKTDGKKGAVHVATPYPSKKEGKTSANKSKQTPKSGGSHSCKPCNRTFATESALESHSKAKHSAAK